MFTGFDEFSVMVQTNGLDIIFVTETWLTEGVGSEVVTIPEYNFFRKDRLVGRGGGVAAYVKSNLQCSEITFDFMVSVELEYLFLKINIHSKKFAIGAFYRPPNTNINNYINDIDNILSTITPTVDEIICLGDFNVNFFNLPNPIDTCLQTYSLTQILDEPTRISAHSSTLIDPIFISNTDLVNQCGTLCTDNISDHKLVFCDLKINTNKIKPKLVTFRCFRNFNYDNFSNDLASLPWHEIIYENNIDKKVDLFNSFLLEIFNRHAPLKTVRVTKPKAPWLTPNLKLLMKERDRAKQKHKQTKSNEDFNRYKELRNYTLSIVRNEKKCYLNSICAENNLRKTWSTLKNLNVHKNNFTNIPDELSDPNSINAYFSSFVQNVSHKCDDKINFYNNNFIAENYSFGFVLTSVEEVNSILNTLKSNAYGTDNISIAMLKYCSPFIDKFIVHIINCCIEKNYFPSAWKTAIGKPLPKNCNPKSFSDLRIISILPVMSKIFERILYRQIYEYFAEKKLLPDSQCGFRKGFGTSTALVSVMDDLFTAYDQGLVSVLVLLDFSKAFDTINHKLLCAKFKYFGFNDASVLLISSYLSDRFQKTFHNNTFSSNLNILSGVPQGSILGPLFFIIYTSDILNSVINCKVQAYADDTQLYVNFNLNDAQQACVIINEELQKIKILSEEHNLHLNSTKSNVMLFGSKHKLDEVKNSLNINIEGIPLPIVKAAKNLGVVIDCDFRFREHVKKLMQKAYSSLKLLYSNRHILNFDLKKMLCEALVLSHFNYCDFIYGPCLDLNDRNRIQKVQNSCLRLIFGLRKFERISHKLCEVNWLNMNNRRKLHLGNFVHNLLNSSFSCLSLKNKFVLRSSLHPINIRYGNKFNIPRHHSAMFKRCFIYNAIQLYNSLSDEFKIFNVNKFKYKYRTLLLSEQQHGS